MKITRHEFLRRLHELTAPRTYLEIGINDGASLALSRTRSVGIDPAFKITKEIACDVALYRETSDAYFARADPLAHFGGHPVDLAFIDGMHLFEYALRDFINIERCAGPYTVVVFDDVLPRAVAEANRERSTRFWTGDVYKVTATLAGYRPDLVFFEVDTAPTGLLVVLAPEPASTVLADGYAAICARAVGPDPQDVPPQVLSRRDALAAEAVLGSPMWETLRRSRAAGATREVVVDRLRPAVDALRTGRRARLRQLFAGR